MEKHRGLQELTDKKVCIVGIGSVGKETAKRFKCFGAEIVGVDIEYKQDKYVDEFFDISQIDAAIMKSDVVILTLPHTPQTHHLVGDKLLKVFKQDAILVNLSRGGIIDESALAERIREGTFLGVALDVFEEEPLNSNNPLWNFENVIITPHNSFVSNKTRERLFTLICHNLESFCREL